MIGDNGVLFCTATPGIAKKAMIQRRIDEIRKADLEALIGIARESKTLEFKAELPRKIDGELVPFIAGVSSLANTDGGDLAIGVVERAGIATSVPGIPISNLDEVKLQLEQALTNGLEPRLPRVDIAAIECGDDRHVLVVRVPRSWVGPHRVKSNDRFYGRNSGGRYPLDVGELRTAFVLSESVADRVRSFRAERLARIVGDGAPTRLHPGGRAILHVIPFSPLAGRRDFDVVQAVACGTHVPLPLGGVSGVNRTVINLDGYANCAIDRIDSASSYAQFFRNGAIEGLAVLGHDERDGRPYIHGPAFCQKVVFALRQYLGVLQAYDMGFPIFVFLSFVDMDGSILRHGAHLSIGRFNSAGPRSGATIVLPEITLESPTADVATALKSVFDALWNAYGLVRCDMYDDQGNWRGQDDRPD